MLVVVLDNLLATFYCKTFLLRDISILDWQCFRAPVLVFLLKTTGLLSFHNRNIQFLIMQHVLPRVPLSTLIVLSFLLDSLITHAGRTKLTFTSSWRKLVLSNRNIGQINFPFIAVPSALRNRNQKNSNLLLLHTLVYYSREFENKLDFTSLSVFEWHSVVADNVNDKGDSRTIQEIVRAVVANLRVVFCKIRTSAWHVTWSIWLIFGM